MTYGGDGEGGEGGPRAPCGDARGTDMVRPVPREVEGMAEPQNRTHGMGPRNKEAPPTGGFGVLRTRAGANRGGGGEVISNIEHRILNAEVEIATSLRSSE